MLRLGPFSETGSIDDPIDLCIGTSKNEPIDVDRCGEMGNTSPSISPKQGILRKNHFLTWNNPPEDAVDVLTAIFEEHCVMWAFQKERGENGTLHIQGVCTCKRPMRWSAFGLPSEIHWEKVRNIINSLRYCTKEDTRVDGPWMHNYSISSPVEYITPDRQYQTFIIELLQAKPSPRDIFWFFDRVGNVGKSSFSKWLVGKKQALFIDEGTKSNIVNMVYNYKQDLRIVVVDVPRANKNKVSYKSLEAIKNGMIMNTKYETGMKVFNSPHIIVFSNFPPDVNNETVSEDRMHVYEITQIFFEAVFRYPHEYADTENIAPNVNLLGQRFPRY